MDITTFLQQSINGLSVGSIYALIAIGYTMVYGVLRLINFAHGDIMMVGTFAVFFSISSFSMPFGASVIVGILIAVVVGIMTDKVAYKPLRNSPRISMLITAIGVSFFLQNLFNVLFGSTPKAFIFPEYFTETLSFSGVIIPTAMIFVPFITLALLLAVLYLLYRTKQGMAIRAVAFDVNTVKLMGIDVNVIIMYVFIIGSALAGIGGVMYAINYPTIDPLMGVMVGLKAFCAAVLGGIGSVVGAVIGGFIIGFTEVVMVGFFPELGGYRDAFAFIFLIFVLLFKPTGIMGEKLGGGRF